MFIGIIGPNCTGKRTVAGWLVSKHKFALVSLRDDGHVVEGEDGVFKKPEEFLEYVTKNWQRHFVICNVEKDKNLEMYRKRPFFLLLAMDGPVSTRYERYKLCCRKDSPEQLTLEEFVRDDDNRLFQALDINGPGVSDSERLPDSSVYDLMIQADITIVNSHQTLEQLYSHLERLDIVNKERLRPSWEDYFMYLSDLAALRANCMKRRVGCILVKDNRVIATGYNGTPKGLTNCNKGGCPRCNSAAPCGKNLEDCLCLHAEENALLEAGKERIGEGCILYCNTCPCSGCTIKLIQVGVKKVIYKESYVTDQKIRELFKQAGVTVEQHRPPNRKL